MSKITVDGEDLEAVRNQFTAIVQVAQRAINQFPEWKTPEQANAEFMERMQVVLDRARAGQTTANAMGGDKA